MTGNFNSSFVMFNTMKTETTMKKITIALVAHDSRKDELIEWVKFNKSTLENCEIYATGTTGKKIEDNVFTTVENVVVKLPDGTEKTIEEKIVSKEIHKLKSGPLGGDSQIGAMICEEKIDCLIFFCDHLITPGHAYDVLGLSRLASLYNIAYATNRTTADMLISSPLFTDHNYERIIPNCIDKYKNRQV